MQKDIVSFHDNLLTLSFDLIGTTAADIQNAESSPIPHSNSNNKNHNHFIFLLIVVICVGVIGYFGEVSHSEASPLCYFVGTDGKTIFTKRYIDRSEELFHCGIMLVHSNQQKFDKISSAKSRYKIKPIMSPNHTNKLIKSGNKSSELGAIKKSPNHTNKLVKNKCGELFTLTPTQQLQQASNYNYINKKMNVNMNNNHNTTTIQTQRCIVHPRHTIPCDVFHVIQQLLLTHHAYLVHHTSK